jgi:hypothetical protein
MPFATQHTEHPVVSLAELEFRSIGGTNDERDYVIKKAN